MKLQQAFDVARGDVVAFIGAGGKTSVLLAMGYELMEQGWRVLATATTAIEEDQLQLMPHVLHYRANPKTVSAALSEYGFVFLYGTVRDGKVYGPAIEWTKQVLDTVDSDVLLVEADTSSGLPFKAPYEGEPVIPRETSLVIPVVSVNAVDTPLDDEHVYNAGAMTERFGFYPGSPVRSPWIAQVLRDEEMGLRGIPEKARVVAFINQTPEDGYLRGRARLIARLALKSPRLNGLALGSARSANPVVEVQRHIGAVVLAGGKSERMGEPKVLLPWTRSKTIIEQIIDQLVKSRLEAIHVVTGYYADDVKQRIRPTGVKVVHNRAYKTGDMLSALKAGLRTMPDHVAAVLVVPGDQPRLQPKVIYRMLRAYAEGMGEILVPTYQTLRGYPVLIGRRYWPEFLNKRQPQSLHDMLLELDDSVVEVAVEHDSVLCDVDTPADYQSERYRAGLQYLSHTSLPKPDAS